MILYFLEKLTEILQNSNFAAFFIERVLNMNNDYEMELVQKVISELNTLLNPVHSLKLRGFTRSDVDVLESAVNVLETIKFKNLLSDNDGYDVLIF